MAAIFPVPTTRATELLIQTRLTSQLQSDLLDSVRLQTQLSTGRRISAPSEDAPAALRAIGLQRLLEQKGQIKVNAQTSQSYLSAADSAIAGVSSLLADIRGTAVTMANTTNDETSRQAAVEQIQKAIEQIADVANQKFRGRYLFSGSQTTTQPFEFVDNFVLYNGNEKNINTFADVDLLLETNVHGGELFGAVSPEKRGTADLNPILTEETRLRDLRGGRGISEGSIIISDGTNSSTVDISSAETIGDLIQLIEANPPNLRSLTVRLSATGLNVDIDDALGGNLTINDVGGGTTAAELEILNTFGTGVSPIIGGDLDPKIRHTTQLSDILGVRASAVLESSSSDNNIVLQATQRGSALNNVTIQYVNDELLLASPGVAAGGEYVNFNATDVAARAALVFSDIGQDNDLIIQATTPGVDFNNVTVVVEDGGVVPGGASAAYDSLAKTLTISIDSGGATRDEVEAAIDATPEFDASRDLSVEGNTNGTIAAFNNVNFTTTGNSGANANSYSIFIQDGGTTANHVVTALQADVTFSSSFSASLDEKDTSSAFLAGQGLVDINASVVTAGGSGIEFDQNTGIQVINGGETFQINFQGAKTIEDMLNILNGSKAYIRAELNEDATGIDIRSRLSGSDFHIGENGGATATELGIRTFNEDTVLTSLNHEFGAHTTEGTDFTITRNDGVELEIDISSAETVGDVLDIINNHVDNLDPNTAIVARLKSTGNGIELVDDNPVGTGTLSISKDILSEAVWDLGLLSRVEHEGRASDSPPPQAASATLAFTAPDDVNNRLIITANEAGETLNGVQVIIANTIPIGNPPVATFDLTLKTLTLDVDPTTTTANDLITAITAEGTFSAALDDSLDPTNNGTGLIVEPPGQIAVASGGTPNPDSTAATALATFLNPTDTAILFTARQAGTGLNDVQIVFNDVLVGDTAAVSYDGLNKILTIDIDATAGTGTTANTIIQEVNNQGLFAATLDTTTDPTNDGTGTVETFGVVATTAGGSAEIMIGTDVNPVETKGMFTALLRLQASLENFDLNQIRRAVDLLDDNLTQVNFVRAELGARQQGLDVLQNRLVDEDIQLRDTLSKEIDVDFAAAISALTARQASYEATLRLSGRLFQLSLINFI